MDIDAELERRRRRAYKTKWQAKKRAAIKAKSGEEIRLFLCLRLARQLRANKPKQYSLRQWALKILQEKAALLPPAPPEPPPPVYSQPPTGADRNKPCPCGCGRKAKDCLAGWVRKQP